LAATLRIRKILGGPAAARALNMHDKGDLRKKDSDLGAGRSEGDRENQLHNNRIQDSTSTR